MKIIVEAQWVIDDSVFNDMMKLSGYEEIIQEYFIRQEAKEQREKSLKDQRQTQDDWNPDNSRESALSVHINPNDTSPAQFVELESV